MSRLDAIEKRVRKIEVERKIERYYSWKGDVLSWKGDDLACPERAEYSAAP